MNGFACRLAGERDIPVLCALADRIWREYYPRLLSPAQIDYMLAWMYAPETLRQELGRGIFWELALEAQEPVGFVSYEVGGVPRKVKLHKIYLLSRLHGRGVGRALLAHVRRRAAALGAEEVRLNVNKANAQAIRAYERAGYQVVESVTNDIGGGFVMDDYIMACVVGAAEAPPAGLRR